MKKFVLCCAIMLALSFMACSNPRADALAAIEKGARIAASTESEARALQEKWERERKEILENDEKMREELETQQNDGGKDDE